MTHDENMLVLHLLNAVGPSDKVKRRDTGLPVQVMDFRPDNSNRKQIEAWLNDAILYADGQGYAVAGILGEITVRPGDYLVLEYGQFMAFRADEFHRQFTDRFGES